MTSPGPGQSPAHQRERHVDARDVRPQPSDIPHSPSTEHLPEAEPVLRALAMRTIEVIAGARDIEQLARWVTDDVYAHLLIRVSIAARARAITGVVAERPRLWIDRVRTWPTQSGGLDAVILVYDKRRAHVIAMQLEGINHRWRATAIAVM
ncbi:MAG: Rv3235 family protein [Cryobacterium sp.]|uniref:Rv3235 family protein n=1 Tax=unclassified Cryobacterium TaxID=2649013 RepID=UPI0018CBA5F6|nr:MULTISPECIES: Rv3235 family protein [unclassified Cryobacterium]MCY7404938.1 Rv3235 family protein [Cryobacterium sp.]MEC5153224.1 hypothetical protein [Cryobacterium sp. CAN_C3]